MRRLDPKLSLKDLLNPTIVQDYLHIRNSLMIPGGNLGIPRSQMPQIKDFEEFKRVLAKFDISVKQEYKRIGDIKITQNQVNKDKVFKLFLKYKRANKRTRGGVDIDGFPPVISSDNYVLDGTHRDVALYNLNKQAYLKYSVVDMPIRDLYSLIKENPWEFTRCVEYTNAL